MTSFLGLGRLKGELRTIFKLVHRDVSAVCSKNFKSQFSVLVLVKNCLYEGDRGNRTQKEIKTPTVQSPELDPYELGHTGSVEQR